MKKKVIIILLIVIALLVGGGIAVWKWNQKKETKSSDNSPSKKPLNQLNDKELEKCLLEDYSRRLELEKYFVFNLGKEVKLERGFLNNVPQNNVRVVNDKLSNDLTRMTELLVERGKITKKINTTDYKKVKKKAITFTGKNLNLPSKEWTDKNLDEKIKEGKDCFIVVDIETVENEKNYFSVIVDKDELCWNGHVIISVESPINKVCENKEKALEILKTDPALKKT